MDVPSVASVLEVMLPPIIKVEVCRLLNFCAFHLEKQQLKGGGGRLGNGASCGPTWKVDCKICADALLKVKDCIKNTIDN